MNIEKKTKRAKPTQHPHAHSNIPSKRKQSHPFGSSTGLDAAQFLEQPPGLHSRWLLLPRSRFQIHFLRLRGFAPNVPRRTRILLPSECCFPEARLKDSTVFGKR